MYDDNQNNSVNSESQNSNSVSTRNVDMNNIQTNNNYQSTGSININNIPVVDSNGNDKLITKNTSNNKKNIIIILILIIVSVISIIFFSKLFSKNKPKYKTKTLNLSEIFDSIYFDKKDFLIIGNKIYYSVLEFNPDPYVEEDDEDFIVQDSINSMNLDGTNNKIICDNLLDDDYISEKYFHFIINNELYYSETYESSGETINRKINLSNCKITKFLEDYRFLKNPGNDKITYMYLDGHPKSEIIKYDLENNKILDKFETEKTITNFILDYDDFNVYYIDSEYDDVKGELSHLYVNDELIFTANGYDLELLLLTDKYIFLYREDYELQNDKYIYQIDLKSHKLVNKIEYKYKTPKGITPIFSDTNDNYFIADKRLYQYNEKTNSFEDILNKKLNNDYSNVYHYGNKLLFDDNNTNILVYDTISKEVKEYSDVLYNYDNNILYIISKNEDTEKVKVEKIK